MTNDEQEMLRIGRRLGWGDTLEECLCHFWIAPDWRDLYIDQTAEQVLKREGFTNYARHATAYVRTLAYMADELAVARLDMLDSFGPIVRPILDAMLWVMQRFSRKPA